jgi:uncharacterized protein
MNNPALIRRGNLTALVIILSTLLLCTYVHDLLILIPGYNSLHNYSWQLAELIDKFLVILFPVAALLILFKTNLKGVIDELRLNASFFHALLFGLLVTLPMLIGFALSRKTEGSPDMAAILFTCLASPLAEEICNRGFGYRQLHVSLKWPFMLSVLPQAIFFGLGHIEKGTSAGSVASIFLITFTAAVFFSWLLLKWDNLWIPVFLHAFMNLWWALFSVSDTAVGGWLSFALQLATVGLAIAATLYIKRQPKDKEARTR